MKLVVSRKNKNIQGLAESKADKAIESFEDWVNRALKVKAILTKSDPNTDITTPAPSTTAPAKTTGAGMGKDLAKVAAGGAAVVGGVFLLSKLISN